MLNSSYSYNAIPYTVPVQSTGAGIGEIANALVNGYLAHQQQQPQQPPPMQLASAAPTSNWLSALFSGGAAQAGGVMPSPSTRGIY